MGRESLKEMEARPGRLFGAIPERLFIDELRVDLRKAGQLVYFYRRA